MTTREIEPFGYVSKAAADTLKDGLSAAIFPDRDGYASVALYAEPVALDAGSATGVMGLDIADDNDGKEQNAFEEWAKSEHFDMAQHSLHWLFLDSNTSAARKGWRAGISYARTRISSALARPASPEVKPVGWETEDEWNLEQRAFAAANDGTLPAGVRELVAELWRQYCLAASPPASPEVKGEPVALALSENDMHVALTTAYRRMGGIAALARSEGGSAKIIEIAVREIAAMLAVVTNPPVDSGGLREALEQLYGAFLSRHGCFPLDRGTAEQKQWNDAMLKARAALKGEPNARG